MNPTQNLATVAEATSYLTSMYRKKPNIVAILQALLAKDQELENALWGVYQDRRLLTAVAIVPTPAYGTVATLASSWNEQVILPLTLPAKTYLPATMAISIDQFPGLTFTNPASVTSTGALLQIALTSTTQVAVGTTQTQNSVFDSLGALVGESRNGLDDNDYRSILILTVAANRSGGRHPDWSNIARILLTTSTGPVNYFEGEADFTLQVLGMALNANIVASVLARAVGNGIRSVLEYSVTPGSQDLLWSYDDAGDGGQLGWAYTSTGSQSPPGAPGSVGTGVGGLWISSVEMS